MGAGHWVLACLCVTFARNEAALFAKLRDGEVGEPPHGGNVVDLGRQQKPPRAEKFGRGRVDAAQERCGVAIGTRQKANPERCPDEADHVRHRIAARGDPFGIGVGGKPVTPSSLLKARDERRVQKLKRSLAAYKLLIIDEFGYAPRSLTG